MRKMYSKFFAYCFVLLLLGHASFSQVVISQVYGGGGNSGATYKNDFIEIFNRGTSSVNLNGWSVQYASATGTSWQKTDLSNVTLAPGQYYLIQEAAGTGGTVDLPAPDAIGLIPMAAGAGKVVLLNTNSLITSGPSCPSDATVVDKVGFGSTSNCFEGSGPTPAPSNTNAVFRINNGCTDNNANSTDFIAAPANPRNTASALNPCSGPVSVSVAAGVNAAEPSSNGTFIVNLSGPAPAGGATVTYTLSGSAIINDDYSDPQSGAITIAAGDNTGTIQLNVFDDNDSEGTEQIDITLTGVTSPLIIGSANASVNIADNDVPVNPYVSLVNTYLQDFNSLAASGSSSALPTGWLFTESGTNANGLYIAGTGSGTGGDTYSFGTTVEDRAFGTLQSGSLVPLIGAQIQNNAGSVITKLKITYTGEQWRSGTASRTDELSFQYSLDATTLSNGTWTDVSALDFITPNTTAIGAKDGNTDAYRKSLTYTLRNLSIPAGAIFLIRWVDVNASGADDGLAVDDFTIEANPVDIIPPVITVVSPVNGATDVSVNTNVVAQFNEDIQKGSGSIRVMRHADNSIFQTLDINSSDVITTPNSLSFTLNNLEVNTGYYIQMDNGVVTDLDGNGFAGISNNSDWTFTTGINIYVANFQNCTSGISDGFSQFSTTGDITWACTTFGRDPSAPSGTTPFPSGVQINGFASGTNVPNHDWLISPSFDLTATTYPLLSFWSRTAFNGQPLQLKVSTDYVSGDPALATWTNINGKFPAQASNSWILSSNINLSSFKQPNVHFAFVYFSDDDEGARWTIDDIALGNSPTPPPPSLTAATTDIQFAYTASGSTSAKTFSFIGNDLTGDITISATGAFTISKDGGSYSSSLTYSAGEANNISKTVYVRFTPTQNNQDFAGAITIATQPGLSTIVNLKGTSIDPATTLEVVNWNIEWFGSTSNGPTNEPQQQANVQEILQNIGADVYGLVEVVDESKLANLVSQMPGYAYVIANYGSHTNPFESDPGPLSEAQKLAFIYKTSVFSNVTTTALLNTGVNTAEDLNNPNYNYWSSGRYPFMMSADVTLNCVTKNVKFILVHAKANTSPTATSYDRRKKGADALYTLLKDNYADDNIVILGDFNDDLDQSITAGFTTTSWSSFTTDAANFTALTLPLSEAGKKSTVSYNDMIDHVVVSNEVQPDYLSASANVLSDVTSLVSNYGSSTSDHYPVFTRYRFSNTTAPSITSCTAQSIFCATSSNTYIIPAFVASDDCGDVVTYSFVITGATERTGSSNDASGLFNIGTSIIKWTATDSWGNSVTCETTVIVNGNPVVSIPDAYSLTPGTLPNTVYIGYTPASSITLTAQASGGSPEYSYSWSTGSTNASATVSPTVVTIYSATVTDGNGCTATANKAIAAIDITARGSKKNGKVFICHNNGSTLEVGTAEVPTHLSHGDMLGSCVSAQIVSNRGVVQPTVAGSNLTLQILPNPSTSYFTLSTPVLPEGQMSLKVMDILGRVIEQKQNLQGSGVMIFGERYKAGLYLVELTQGKEKVVMKVVKL